MRQSNAYVFIYWNLLISAALANVTLPTPFDTGYNYGLTSSCNAFFSAFLSSASFQACPSFGFLLTKSNQFNQISRNNTALTPVLQALCATTSDQCVSLMQQYATQMVDSKNCGTDIQSNNTIAVATLYDFESYQPMQSAGCLQDTTGEYCYVQALNMSQGTSIYYLPEGSVLPNSTYTQLKFQCNNCNAKILSLYSNYSTVQSEPINSVWQQALTVVNETCGTAYLQSAGINYTSTAASGGNLYIAVHFALLMLIASILL
ncbi:hypothetical protein BGW37DRAFT_487675 [Umbelopsis sp. PMI_123]|nr:hypothetical protein BGW37DRAFT_487675 [Umbelopsis sp. PMI_123]